MFEDCFITDTSTPGHHRANAELINLCKKKKQIQEREHTVQARLGLEPQGQGRQAALEKWAVTTEVDWNC